MTSTCCKLKTYQISLRQVARWVHCYCSESFTHINHIIQESPLRLIFTDLSSCIGGVNRRDVCVVFCLEESDEDSEITNIVSTKVLHVKVCENAKRDMKTHERQRKTKPPKIVVQTSDSVSQGKKEQYWVLATNKRNYDALVKVGAVMEENAGGDVDVWREEVDTFNKKKTRVDLDNADA